MTDFPDEIIYLLYGGTSEDGCGPGVFEGYTTDIPLVKNHMGKIDNNPYSTGYVIEMKNYPSPSFRRLFGEPL
jgi:hypothetical protein